MDSVLICCLKAMVACYDNNILALKEEGDSPRINQAYDKYVAKEDKVSKVESLAMVQSTKHIRKGVVDKWGLVHVGIYKVRAMNPETWTRSFRACNMDPIVRLTFPGWSKKIESVIQIGQSFKSDEGGVGYQIDTYILLPSIWYGMSPDEKKDVVAIIDKHGGYYVACLLELYEKCFIATKEFHSICVCVECSSKEPAHLERGVPMASELVISAASNTVLGAVEASTKGINDGLNFFLVKPPGLKGKEVFAHMVGVRLTNTKSTLPRKFLDIVVSTCYCRTYVRTHKDQNSNVVCMMGTVCGSLSIIKTDRRIAVPQTS